MKKLLLLGGSRYLLPVIEASHKLGYYTITCDYLPNNIAHGYSDQYCNINITDKDAVLKAAKSMKIDGIMSFACDPGVTTAAYVAEKMGLATCGSYKSVEILQNKRQFRDFLKNHGFNVPMAKGYTSISNVFEDIGQFRWPVIVKPTDSAGSKGVTRVDDPEKLLDSIRYAISFSRVHEFIIEEFLDVKGYASDTDCFSVNGELKFISFSSQRFDKQASNPYVPCAYSWPTEISNQKQKELTSELQRLIKLLNFGTSIYNIETRESTNGKTYIMEVSPRGGGNRLAEMLHYITGIDLITNAVRAAMGDPIINIKQKSCMDYWAEIIIHSNQTGVFDSLWISDKISSYIVEKDLWVQKGDIVNQFSGADKAIGTLIMKFDTLEKMEKVLSEQEKYMKVFVV